MVFVRRVMYLIRIVFAVVVSLIVFNAVHAQATLEIVIFRSPDSLTIYLPGMTPVNITGLTIEATTSDRGAIRQEVGTLRSFLGLPYDRVPTPICFRMTRTMSDPLPLECPTNRTINQELSAADVFWYEPGLGDRTLVIYLGDNIDFCPANRPRCEMIFTVVQTPTPDANLTIIGTPRFTPTALAAPTLDTLVGFDPVASNEQWEVITQDFDGITMVFVPSGCFTMGTTDEQAQYAINELDANPSDIPFEQPTYQQCFEEPFWIDQTEVTQGDFERLGGERRRSYAYDGDNRPVDDTTWIEAQDFCELRGMRLPTEREWEYAARGPDNLIFPWGNTWEDNAVWQENANASAEVGSIPEGISWVGALDMSGNVWEWSSTIFGIDNDLDFNYREASESLFAYPYMIDEREQVNSRRSFIRVIRGGGWDNPYRPALRTAARRAYRPDAWDRNFGFRCAADYDTIP